MTKHTPGPWTIEPFNRWDKDIVILQPRATVDYDDVDQDEAEANARLIAAAPELLEALFFSAELADEALQYTNNAGAEIALRHISRKARAAIAKATGEAA